MAISQAYVFDTEGTGRFLTTAAGKGGQTGVSVANTTPVVFTIGPAVFGWLSFNLECLTGSTLAGTWTIGVCNDYRQGTGINPETGHWTDVSACFRTPNATTGTSIPAVTSGAYTAWVQFMTASGIPTPCAGAAYQITFTPTSGSGTIRVVANNAPAGAGF